MKAREFYASNKTALTEKVQAYLSGEIQHKDMANYAWDLIEEGQKLPKGEPYAPGEDTFWAIIWSLQHLADAEHWEDGVTQSTLKELLHFLETGACLPKNCTGTRPNG